MGQDIYGAAVKNQELFLKTDLMDFGAGDLGYIWENNPAKRKAASKKILPALSTKSIRSMEPTMHNYLDLFITRMKELGGGPEGCLMNDVRFTPILCLYYARSDKLSGSGFSG
jgi:hypothetical protein